MSPRRLAMVLAVAVWLQMPTGAAAQSADLEQRIDAGQEIVEGEKVLAAGHVDVGPRFVDDRWTLMLHDDAAKADPGGESVWRHLEQTVLRVTDAGRRPAPDDPDYAFLHARPGADVYVVPQTQQRDVVWVGWNTQDPEVMERLDRGVTMTLAGVQGPGSLVVFLQSGSFARPKVLWDSAARPRPIWVDVNTHTHANWVFSAPGVYLVRVKISADLVDGSKVTDTRDLRFAVGSRTSTDAALAADWRGPDAPARGTGTAAGAKAADGSDGSTPVVIVIVAVGLLIAVAVAAARGSRAKRRARAAGPPDEDAHQLRSRAGRE